MFARRVLTILTLLAAASACRRSTPAAPTQNETKLPPLEVRKEGSWLFTYMTPEGAFATTDKADEVPAPSRRLVRVVDPSKAAAERRDTTVVYVVDLAEVLRAGKAAAKALSREAFETGALAQLPPGESSLLSARPAGAHADP